MYAQRNISGAAISPSFFISRKNYDLMTQNMFFTFI
jgi:hypothetical protein